MAFFEERFPDRIAAGATGGPRFKTSSTKLASGKRHANRDWQAPLHFYDVSQGIKSVEDFKTVRNFFWVVYGAYDGFRFKAWDDYQCTADEGVMTLISVTTYQLGKAYTYGSRSVVRNILKPVAGKVKIFRTRDSLPSDITVSSTVDSTTGIVTITGNMEGDLYSWSGEFDVPVIFSDDSLDAKQLGTPGRNEFVQWDSIQLEELRTL